MEQRNFYAILPAYVRYDNELSSTAKLMYAEITALCNDKGYCWATNKYFSDMFKISDRQVQRTLKNLSNKKYIKIIIDKNTKRKIFVLDTPDKNVIGGTTLMSQGYDKNVVHNNKKNKNNEYKEYEIFDYDWINEK
ncbi:MAG: helix-turn-helix domain-containing protein [Bacilli bacterium]|nr:helix-turn-helix domain-containing protein [Bacilli bacterium]